MQSHLEVGLYELSGRERELERIVSELRAQVAQIQQQVLSIGGGLGGGTGPSGGSAVFRVTTAVPKMVGSTPGVGHGTLQTLAAGTYTATAFDADLYSILTDKIVSSGAYVKAAQTDGVWLVDTVDACAHLTAGAGGSPPPRVGPTAASAAPTLSPASPEVLGVGGVTPRFTFAHGSPVRGGF